VRVLAESATVQPIAEEAAGDPWNRRLRLTIGKSICGNGGPSDAPVSRETFALVQRKP
jgi:hypothetical protein